MDNEIKELIEAFRAYRDLLTPVQANLHSFADTYDSLKGDIAALNTAFGSDVQGKLQSIYDTLSNQSAKATDLSSRIDKFAVSAERYVKGVEGVLEVFEKTEAKIKAVDELEKRAEEQIGKLDGVIEEKKKGYNLKELERTLDSYNGNVQKVAEFINQDVAKALSDNGGEIAEIKKGNEELVRILNDQNSTLERLVVTYQDTNRLIKSVVEQNDVNEIYLFEMLDRWAESRKVKVKK